MFTECLSASNTRATIWIVVDALWETLAVSVALRVFTPATVVLAFLATVTAVFLSQTGRGVCVLFRRDSAFLATVAVFFFQETALFLPQ